MNSMRQWILIGLVAGTWATGGKAQEPMDAPPGERPGPGLHEGRMRGGPSDETGMMDILRDPETEQALALTDAQKDKIKTLTTQFRKEMIDWNAKLQHAALGLADVMGQAEPDEAAALKALDETSRIRAETAKLRIKQLFAVRAVLTAEQRQKARELLKTRMSERRKGGAGKGGKRQQGPSEPPPAPPEAPENRGGE